MHADITRDTFDPARDFTRVLMQQGRVPLDADLNEQASIHLHYLRALATDLIGPHGGPRDDLGFAITWDEANRSLTVGRGRYYVNGVLCENSLQRDLPLWRAVRTEPGKTTQAEKEQEAERIAHSPFMLYLEVWERLVTAYHDPLLREAALGGPDTAARAQVVWRVRAAGLAGEKLPGGEGEWTCGSAWQIVKGRLGVGAQRGGLEARAGAAKTDTGNPCVLPPDARFRGMENQLYRVEVHTGGQVLPGLGGGYQGKLENAVVGYQNLAPGTGTEAPGVTFKWSRENGSVVFAIRSLQGNEVEVETLGLDPRLDLAPGDWVEITDDERAADGRGILAQVADVDRDGLRVMLEDADGDYPEYDDRHANLHPLLRRWDQSDPVIMRGSDGGGATKGTLQGGAVRAVPGWIELEAGIIVRFQAGRTYRAGDYWLVPARVATGDVEWPREPDGDPLPLPARRDDRWYAPLAVVLDRTRTTDCRRKIIALTEPA
ncbi:MAG TPA: DUF6519 domain-containing protein [Longimicrobium sp.]|nr:DUF6519 domain-containing protein [Longimicrobium sp.]